MWSVRVVIVLVLSATVALVAACSRRPSVTAAPEAPAIVAFHEDNEQACIASGRVRETRFVTSRSSLGGPGACGAERPFLLAAAFDGRVALKPEATLRCPMIPAVERWIASVVMPAARRHLGQEIVELKVAASYACRPRNNLFGGKLSEHGRANALDISAFVLADGEQVTVKGGWNSLSIGERFFLRAVHKGACDHFTTVLGPNADRFHHDHFHFDLARHGRDGRYRVCK